MKVIVGLGNPGSNYSSTKHNFGFWIIDKLVEQSSLKYKAGKGEYVFAQSNEYVFVKPTTYMNNSGIAIKQFLNYYKIDVSNLIIIYDDIDIDLGRIKFRATGTAGGHNGIKSIIYHLQTDTFDRLKIGIATSMNMSPSEEYVLKAFPEKYNNLINEVIENATLGVNYYLDNGISETMNNFN
jgi:PTH1 family peptidyl-tRNA hydrolase